MKSARGNIEQLLDLPHVQTAGEGSRFWQQLDSIMADAHPRGNLVADAHIVALMLENGV